MILEVIGGIAVCIWGYLVWETLCSIRDGLRYIAEIAEDGDPDDDTPEDMEPPEDKPTPIRAVSGG